MIPKQIIDLAFHPMIVQFLIRLELLLFNCWAGIRLAKAVDSCFEQQSKEQNKVQKQYEVIDSTATIGSYYLLITASQFHIPFYSSRLLPNTFALLFVTNAYADWFRGYYRRTAIYLVFTTAVFRCDMLLLLFTVGLSMLIKHQLTVIQALCIGFFTGIASLVITVPLDSLLWGRALWPEFEVWWFNTVDNRSSEWGEMVWHWYFSRALPKSLMTTAVLTPLAFMRLPVFVQGSFGKGTICKNKPSQFYFFDWCPFPFFAPVFGFVVLYSFLPHKEMRFIFPAIPMFNVCSAYGMSRLHRAAFSTSKNCSGSSWSGKTLYLCGLGSIILTLVASLIFLRLSSENYPGGVALQRLRSHLVDTITTRSISKLEWNDIHVHVDVAAAMTGVSLFGQRHASIRQIGESSDYEGPFVIDKSGYEEENKILVESDFTHLLTERPQVNGYRLVDTVRGHPRLDIRKLRVATDDAIFIHEKDISKEL